VRVPRDLGGRALIAFASGCSYRKRLEQWLGRGTDAPRRVMEFGSYHAIVACVCAGAGVAIVPRSVLELAHAARQVDVTSLPAAVSRARTMLAWRSGHRSTLLEALKAQLKPR
jgi:DNA-binding transcriptional LysR family regulator